MEKLVKNNIFPARIEGLNSQGHGVCRVEGRAVFVPNAIPDELWEIQILKVSATAVYAKGIELLEASPERIEPACPVFGKCGGCSVMHMSYERELSFKLAKVNEAFHRLGKLDFSIETILGADSRTNYRNKAIYAVGNGVTGFFRGRSHDIIPVGECQIQSPVADTATAVVRGWMMANNIPAYNEKNGKGTVRHVFTRTTRDNSAAVVCIVSARGFGAKTDALVAELRSKCPEITGVVLNINKNQGNTVLAGQFHTLWGSEILSDNLCGHKFELSPQSFFQINPAQAEKLYSTAVEYADCAGETVLDLYCGAGTISLCLADGAKRVIGAEIVQSAVENATHNAEINGIENAEFICADASEVAKQFLEIGLNPKAVVVDPPRKGLTPDVIESVAKMEPERVVYVSCDPATMARDLKIFGDFGYKPSTGTAVDMFPFTSHIECCVLLTR